MDEKPVATARASVMLFDPLTNSWIASGSTPGISKVQLFRHQINNTYRVVAWKLNDKEVVLNCAIFRGLKYNQARPTFHQWRDTKHQVNGLNFTNKEEAEQFASSIMEALENLNQIYRQTQQIIAQHQQIDMQHGNYVPEFQQQLMPLQPQQSQIQSQPQIPQTQQTVNYQTQISGNSTMPEYALPQKQQMQQMNVGSLNNLGDNYSYGAPSSSNGASINNEYRSSSQQQEEIPKAAPNQINAAPPPPPPPGPPPPTAAPPPPPGPPPLSTITIARPQPQQLNDSDEESNQSGLASQLRQAKLKTRGGPVENAETSNQNKNVTTSSTLGRAGGDSMMSEMQRVLAARKKAKEVVVKTECYDSGGSGDSSTKNSQWRQNHQRSQSDCDQVNGANNPTNKPADPVKASTIQCATLGRKGSLQPDQQPPAPTLTRQDMDNFKREILQEVRSMIQQFKVDIIDVIRTGKP